MNTRRLLCTYSFFQMLAMTLLCCRATYPEDETSRLSIIQSLEQNIFRNYDKDVVPKPTAEKGVRLTFDLALNQIIDVNKRAKTMSVVVWVRQYWNDYRLQWSEAEYGGVESIAIQASQLWLPDITLYNNAHEGYNMGNEASQRLTIASDGNVSRYFPTIYTSSCNLDVTHFPFDDQICTLQLGSWAYNMLEIDLYNAADGDTTPFVPNGEWLLLGMPAVRNVVKFRCCPHPYVYLVYKIHIRRRALYYLINCFMPCLIMLALTILSFYLPSESGERMSVGIIILLSLSIIQLMLSDSLPPTSEVPIIVKYYGLTTSNIFLSLVFSCAVLTLYHQAPRPLPNWITLSLCTWGATLVRMCGRWKELQKRRKRMEAEYSEGAQHDGEGAPVPNRSVVEWIPLAYNPSAGITMETTTRRSAACAGEPETGREPEPNKNLMRKLKVDEILELFREEWKFASQVLNKLFMWALVAAIASNVLYVCLNVPRNNFFIG